MAVFDTLAARLGVVVAAFVAVVVGAGTASALAGASAEHRRAEARAVLTSCLEHVRLGDDAGARRLRCDAGPGVAVDRGDVVGLSVGTAERGVVGGMLAFPVVLRRADGGVEELRAGVALRPDGPLVCGGPWRS
jgi:hypothetical protein